MTHENRPPVPRTHRRRTLRAGPVALCALLLGASGCQLLFPGSSTTAGLSPTARHAPARTSSAPAEENPPGEARDPVAPAAASGGDARASVQLQLRPGFRANPTRLRGRTLPRTRQLRRSFPCNRSCYGWVSAQPDAVLHLPQGLGRTRITLRGGGRPHVTLPGNRFFFGERKLTMKRWPAGRLEIRFARVQSQRGVVAPFTIEIEDLSRPRDLGWAHAAKPRTLPRPLKAPLLLQGRTPRTGAVNSRHHRDDNCRQLGVGDQPVLVFRLRRPREKLRYNLSSTARVYLQLEGPIPASGRRIPTQCRQWGRGTFRRLEPGLYALRIGTKVHNERDRRRHAYSFVLYSDATRLDPLKGVARVPDNLPLRQRMVTDHFPQLNKGFWRSTATLQRLFATAPKGLYVFPSFDLDKSSARSVHWQPTHTAYPRKNEPLLLIANRWVVAADGALFEVKRYSYLKVRPDGPIALPRGPRNPHLKWFQAKANRGKEDVASIRRYLQALKRERRCVDRVWAPFNRRIRAVRQGPYSRWRARRIGALKDRAGRRAFQVCGTAALRRHFKRLQKRLQRTRTRRRAKRLARIRRHMRRLFR